MFGGAIGLPGGLDYVNFLVPGFITTGVLFGGMGASIAMAEDMEQGFVDRFPLQEFLEVGQEERHREGDELEDILSLEGPNSMTNGGS